MGNRVTKRMARDAVQSIKGLGVLQVLLTAYGKAGDPKWVVDLNRLNAEGVLVEGFRVADDAGKMKYFGTVDSALKFVADVAEDSKGDYSVVLTTGAMYASKVPANIVTDAENKITKLNKVKVDQVAKAAELQTLLTGAMAGWGQGNAAQRARYEETVLQRETVLADVQAIDDQVAVLEALVGAAG